MKNQDFEIEQKARRKELEALGSKTNKEHQDVKDSAANKLSKLAKLTPE